MFTNILVFITFGIALLYILFKVYVALYTEYLLYYLRKSDEDLDIFVPKGCNGYSWKLLKELKAILEKS